MPDPQQKPKEMSSIAAYALVGQLGYMIAIPAVLFGFGGAYLDKYLGSSPIFLIIGLILAFTGSSVGVWRMVQRLQEMDQARSTSPDHSNRAS